MTTGILKILPAMSISKYLGVTYKLSESENFDEFMKELKVGLVTRKVGNRTTPSVTLTEEDGVYTLTTMSTFKNTAISFKLGVEFDEKTIDGRDVKSTITAEGNKLIHRQTGDVTIEIIREFSNDVMVATMKVNNVVCTLPADLVWAVPGKDVELPCDITPEGQDSLSMVLWFKGASGIPLYSIQHCQLPASHLPVLLIELSSLNNLTNPQSYEHQSPASLSSDFMLSIARPPVQMGVTPEHIVSLDARNGSVLHWAMGSDLGGRSYFLLGKGSNPARLRITRVLFEDEGIYRCRVDFLDSPTRNFKFNLTLVVMPSDPMVFDHQGREVTGVAGPYLQGYDLFLSCHVVGGRPRPLVSWWRDTTLLDDKMESVTASLSVNHYSRPNVSRDLFNSRLQCRVVVSPLVPALTKEIRVDVYLKPERVEVSALGEVRSAGRPQQFECESWGSMPPARISWFMEGEPVRQATVTSEEGTNSTVGVLTYKPSAEDDGRELTCRAENPRFPGSILEISMQITVHYPPAVAVRVETGLDLQSLREGDDVSLVCKVRAHPEPTHVGWFHGEMYLSSNESSGVVVDGISLHLLNLTNEQAGEYSCAARNTEGDKRSTPVFVRVQYAPVCSPTYFQRTIAALRHETVRVRCEVRADPAQVRFRWTFNSSGEVLPVPPARILSPNTSYPSSFVDFTPVSEEDFGTLACWASNTIGFQAEPCVTHIIPARTPEPPQDCHVDNHSTGGLEVVCHPGDNGGLQQHFLLEALESPSTVSYNGTKSRPFFPVPVLKVLGSEPVFLLQGLEPGREYQLRVHAVNGKGQSDPPVVIPYVKIENSSSKLHSIGSSNGADAVEDQSTSLLVILGSLIGVAILVVCGLAFTTGLLACRKRAASTAQLQRKYENALQEAQEALQRQEDAFVIKIPLPKVNNTSRKSMYDVPPVDGDLNDLRNVHDVLSVERPAIQTVVIRRNHVSLPTELRNSTFRQSLVEPRRVSSGYQTVNTSEDTPDVSMPDERKMTATVRNVTSPVAPAPMCALVKKSTLPVALSNDVSTAQAREHDNSQDGPVLVRTSFMEDSSRRSHPRVTLDPEGQVLRCIIPPDCADAVKTA